MTRQELIRLPWPPSVNTYWRHIVVGKRAATILSKNARAYHVEVAGCVLEQGVRRHYLTGKLAVEIWAYPPDLRARDLDNLPKGILDSLKRVGVIRDDCDIDDLRIKRGVVRKGGALEILISELPGLSAVSGYLFDKDQVRA